MSPFGNVLVSFQSVSRDGSEKRMRVVLRSGRAMFSPSFHEELVSRH